jgi:hypothetical protein
MEVVANLDGARELEVEEGTVAPGGVVARSRDGSVTAGLFTRWSGVPLPRGAHWIVEERDATGITLSKPSGSDSVMVVRPLAEWGRSTPIEVRAMSGKGELIRTLGVSWTQSGPLFTAARWLDGREVDHWRIVDPTKERRRRGARR